jgi:Flp pilus assembly pilin Flp
VGKRRRSGQTLVEYGLILALVAAVAVVALALFGHGLQQSLTHTAGRVNRP